MSERILVTGSQGWTDYNEICRILKPLWILTGGVLVSGACPRGADALCEHAWRRLGGEVERHRIESWSRFGHAAGIRRSEHMVSRGAAICVAFILPCELPGCQVRRPSRMLNYHGTHGSVHCADFAEDHGIPTRRYPPVLVA